MKPFVCVKRSGGVWYCYLFYYPISGSGYVTSPEAVSKLINDLGQNYAICNVEKISALSDNRSYQA